MRFILNISIWISLILFFSSCRKSEHEHPLKGKTIYGKPVTLGTGTARSWASFDSVGAPAAVGVSISESAIAGLSGHSHHTGGHMAEYELELPEEIKLQTAFNHVVVDWNPMGHPPAIYQLPHLDAHFYMITSAERKQVGDEQSDPKILIAPAARYLPEDYTDVQVNVPQMGKHWIDRHAPELNGRRFTQSFIYGSYDGKITFLEPMFTLEYLLSHTNRTYNIKQPACFQQKNLYYPTQYSFRYNKERKEYTISLDKLKLK